MQQLEGGEQEADTSSDEKLALGHTALVMPQTGTEMLGLFVCFCTKWIQIGGLLKSPILIHQSHTDQLFLNYELIIHNALYLSHESIYTLILVDLTFKHTFNKKVNLSTTQNLVFRACLIPYDSRWLRFHCRRKRLTNSWV